MIHLIYIYFIVNAFVLGYVLEDYLSERIGFRIFSFIMTVLFGSFYLVYYILEPIFTLVVKWLGFWTGIRFYYTYWRMKERPQTTDDRLRSEIERLEKKKLELGLTLREKVNLKRGYRFLALPIKK